MDRWLEWLLDLQDIRIARDAPLLLRWERPFHAWELFCFAVVAVAWVLIVYRQERVSAARKTFLACARCAVIVLVVAMLSQPTLVLQRNRVEPSHVVLAADTSLSMGRADVYRDAELLASIARGAGLDDVAGRSRLELVQAALTRDDAAALTALLSRQPVHLVRFDSHMESQGFFEGPEARAALALAVTSLEADGTITDLPGTISETIEKAGGRRLSALVLASDGRNTQAGSLDDALRVARGRQIPIYPIRIGSPVRPLDVEIGLVRARESVFVNDVLVGQAQLLSTGLTEPTPVDLQLIDERSGAVVATERITLDPADPVTTAELRVRPTQPGVGRYRVEVPPLPHESSTENNAAPLTVTVLDRRLRVLYVEGYPRYEYRYLKNALIREPTIELSVLLLEADEEFIQEGTDPIRRFPESPDELQRYDVVLFGDVDPRGGWLTPAQMTMLLDYVGHDGGGFGLIAGERWAPQRFLGTPLEKLLPVRIDPAAPAGGQVAASLPTYVAITPEGKAGGLFRFAADRGENDRLLDSLPPIYWFARTLGPKPGASVLAEHPTAHSPTGRLPLTVLGRYGAGKLFFEATDDTWRWRRHSGELLHDAYWVQVARELMRAGGSPSGRRFIVRTDRRVYPYGTAIRAQAEILDPALLSQQSDAITLTATETRGDSGSSPQASSPIERFEVHRLSSDSNLFEGTWIAARPGPFALDASDIPPLPDERRTPATLRVEAPNLEFRRPDADHEALQRLAAATGGRVIELDQLEAGFAEIRDRSAQLPDDVVEPLWDSKLALGLFVALLLIEWVGRKAFDLL